MKSEFTPDFLIFTTLPATPIQNFDLVWDWNISLETYDCSLRILYGLVMVKVTLYGVCRKFPVLREGSTVESKAPNYSFLNI